MDLLLCVAPDKVRGAAEQVSQYDFFWQASIVLPDVCKVGATQGDVIAVVALLERSKRRDSVFKGNRVEGPSQSDGLDVSNAGWY